MKISGKLIGRDSAHIHGATVQVHDGGGKISETTSNENGIFECAVADSFADAPLNLHVLAAGYQPFEKQVQCSEDTDLHDLQLSPVSVTPPPAPPTPPVTPVPPPPAPVVPKPRSRLPLAVGGLVLLLACAWGLKSYLRPRQILSPYAGTWTEDARSDQHLGHITHIIIPSDPRSTATIIYYQYHIERTTGVSMVPQNEAVTIIKSRNGYPSFAWSIGDAKGTKELRRIGANTMHLVTIVSSGTPPPAQLFKKH